MSLLDSASNKTDAADLTVMAIVETVRDQNQPVTPSTICSIIGGAPYSDVKHRLERLSYLGLLEVEIGNVNLYWLSELGAELLRRDLVGWSPSIREENRRTLVLEQARKGLLRSRLR